MPPTIEPSALGLPVEVNSIDRELKKLWADGEGAKTRASLINLVVYSEDPGSLARNTQLISQLTQNHACRAVVIAVDPRAQEESANAWISAHCHMRGSAKHVCSEQISFLLHGRKLLTSLMFSHLDSDLPLYLWWQSEFSEPMDPQLWSWVDRVIYDSRAWRNFPAQRRLLETAQREADQRQMVLCDLNWARLLHFRLAFAQFFDHPASHHHFNEITDASLVYGRDHRSTAVLFVGWIASQLGWNLLQANGAIGLQNSAGKPLKIELREEGVLPMQSFTARSGNAEFHIRRAACGDLLEVWRGPGEGRARQLLPADDGGLAQLVSEELLRGGTRLVYLRAMEKIHHLL